MTIQYRPARPTDIAHCIWLRGQTRENAVPAERLAAMGITEASWAADVAEDRLPGFVAEQGEQMAGYCFGDAEHGEIVVLALLPAFEGQGIGRHLLQLTTAELQSRGHRALFLACSSDPKVRSHGFYRHLGWRGTGQIDERGDERLEYCAG